MDCSNQAVVKLQKLPSYILVKLNRTRATKLYGLEEAVIPVEPMAVKMQIKLKTLSGKTITRTVTRKQFPMTGAYAFTDYRSQGQTILYLIVDIANPPSGKLSLFNLYVALSRGIGQDNIRLLRDFDEEGFRRGQMAELTMEDERLEELDKRTKHLWSMTST